MQGSKFIFGTSNYSSDYPMNIAKSTINSGKEVNFHEERGNSLF